MSELLLDKIEAAIEREPDRRVQMWLRVRLGGERMTEVARAYGYQDGSGVHRVVARLETRAETDRGLAARLDGWRARVSSVKS